MGTAPRWPRLSTCSTHVQFDKAYPEAEQLRVLKCVIDPAAKFSNKLWQEYPSFNCPARSAALMLARLF
jgi:hypothetical protein